MKPTFTWVDQPVDSYKSHSGGSYCKIYKVLTSLNCLSVVTTVVKARASEFILVKLDKWKWYEGLVSFLPYVQFSMCSNAFIAVSIEQKCSTPPFKRMLRRCVLCIGLLGCSPQFSSALEVFVNQLKKKSFLDTMQRWSQYVAAPNSLFCVRVSVALLRATNG